jgi:4-amino-4-deoxy-L-arabinose transferase-like glycosyltransferase
MALIRNERYFLLFIFFLATLLGIIFAIKTGQLPSPEGKVGDVMGYSEIAENIAKGNGFSNGYPPQPTSIRAPLYPFFISIVYMLFGVNYMAVKIIQALILGLTSILIYMIAK